MSRKSPLWLIGVLVAIIGTTIANENLYRKAQYYYQPRYEEIYAEPEYNQYGQDGPGEYLSNDEDIKRSPDLENLLLEYLEDNPNYERGYNNLNKRIYSYFRERMAGNGDRKRESLEEILMNKIEDDNRFSDDEEEIEELCDRYRLSFPELSGEISRLCGTDEVSKRSFSDYYTNLGWDSIGMKKRSRSLDPQNRRELLSYILKQNSDAYDNMEKYTPSYYSPYKRGYSKKFPVTKRSSNYYNLGGYAKDLMRPVKRSPQNKANPTSDPKVVKDLSNIFTPPKSKAKSDDTKKPVNVKSTTKSSKTDKTTTLKPKTEKKAENEKEQKEVVPNNSKEVALPIQKKSVSWSDYFGMDRRKKSGNDLDKEWLLERYHKSIAMTTKKRSNQPQQEAKKENKDTKNVSVEDALSNMEESLVDDTLKYTGAHEDAEDPQEIQEIKSNIMNRLVAAYNLEKMRQALAEYRMSVQKQRTNWDDHEKYKNGANGGYMGFPVESKRVSVPRKSAIDDEREKSEVDNSIKCTDCNEPNYNMPAQLLRHTNWEMERYSPALFLKDCPLIERACNEAGAVLGANGKVIEEACNVLQFCLSCEENIWPGPSRICYNFYISKADELCNGDIECQNAARHSVKYLEDVYKSLRTEIHGRCDLPCPRKRR